MEIRKLIAAALAASLLTTGIGNRDRDGDGVTAIEVGVPYPYPDIPCPQSLMGSQALAPEPVASAVHPNGSPPERVKFIADAASLAGVPAFARAFPRTLGQFLFEMFGGTGGLIALDGPTGYGKTTFADVLESEIKEAGFTGNVVVLLLDDFHKPSDWRYAMAKLSVGQPLEDHEHSLLNDNDRKLATGPKAHLIEGEFYQNDLIRMRLEQIRRVLDSSPGDPLDLTFTVDSFDRVTENTFKKTYTIRRGDIVILEGKYANQDDFIPLFDFRARLAAHEDIIQRRYEQRTRALSPGKVALRLEFYSAVVWPSWVEYNARTHPHLDLMIDLDGHADMYHRLEAQIVDALGEGPLTGKELMQKFPLISADALWQVTMLSPNIKLGFAGVHYPRIGKSDPPFANLSPSLMREFYNYTAIAKRGDSRLADKIQYLTLQRQKQSTRKFRQAQNIVYALAHQFAGIGVTILLSGDVAQEMAHGEKRQNDGSGHFMEGSDFDFLVIVPEKTTPEEVIRVQSTFMLAQDFMPDLDIETVEVDCDVFRPSEIAKLSLNDPKDLMHAKNILQSKLLFGNPALADQAQTLLREAGFERRIDELSQEGLRMRRIRKMRLLATDVKNWTSNDIEFFLGTFESFVEVGKLIYEKNTIESEPRSDAHHAEHGRAASA